MIFFTLVVQREKKDGAKARGSGSGKGDGKGDKSFIHLHCLSAVLLIYREILIGT